MTFIKRERIFFIASFAIAIIVFMKNAWVSEDAYILFRSLEQLFAGNGPRWNPHERVQVFTSPLWYCFQALIRIFSRDVYLNVIILSFVLWLSTLLVLKSLFRENSVLLLSVGLFTASTGFFDYTSSGLENVLAYVIIAIYLLNYLRLFQPENLYNQTVRPESHIITILILFGLIICVRHDLSLLLLPPTFYVVFKNFRIFPTRKWLVMLVLTFLPFMIYTLFSIIYFGFPFPNTAYAKINTHIQTTELIHQGIKYLWSSLKNDLITLLVITGTMVFVIFKTNKGFLKFIMMGIVLNLLYIISVGGDFMQGRFLSYSFLISVVILMFSLTPIMTQKLHLTMLSAVLLFLVFYPHTPFNSPLNYTFSIKKLDNGIADERGYYFRQLSLYKYILSKKNGENFPQHNFATRASKFLNSPEKVAVFGNIGVFGYYSGTEKIIIDNLSLADALLARMPVKRPWRIGHFKREIPDGYLESVRSGRDEIKNPGINEYYRKLKIIIQNDRLFAADRLKTIILFNLGAYNYLLTEKSLEEAKPQ